MDSKSWFYRSHGNFDHIIWLVLWSLVFVLFLFQLRLLWQKWRDTLLAWPYVAIYEQYSFACAILASGSLIVHEILWLTNRKNYQIFVRLPLVFISIQLSVLLYISKVRESINIQSHGDLAQRPQTHGQQRDLCCHTCNASCCHRMIQVLFVLSILLSLLLAIMIPIVSYQSLKQMPAAYVAYIWFIFAMGAIGSMTILYWVSRKHHPIAYPEEWASCRLQMLPFFFVLYILISFLAYDEVAREARAISSDDDDTHQLSIVIVMFFLLILANSKFLRRYQGEPPPAPPSQNISAENPILPSSSSLSSTPWVPSLPDPPSARGSNFLFSSHPSPFPQPQHQQAPPPHFVESKGSLSDDF